MVSKKGRKVKFISLLIGLIFLALLIYSFVNFAILKNSLNENLNSKINQYGYLAVFIVSVILEILPQPFVSAIIPYTNGLLLGLGFRLSLFSLLMGALFSSLIGYYLGVVYGERVLKKFIDDEDYKKYLELFHKYGRLGMTIAAFTPLPYLPMVPGMFKMSFKNFVVYALIPRIVYFTLLGWAIFIIL